jgi:hypothetical protein
LWGATKPEVTFEWKIPYDKEGRPLSNAIERDRARTYFQAYPAAAAHATLAGERLDCAECAAVYDVRAAGKGLSDPLPISIRFRCSLTARASGSRSWRLRRRCGRDGPDRTAPVP